MSYTPNNIGELVTSTVAVGSAVSLTTATPANITSISLTAGTWLVSHQVDFVLGAASATNFKTGPGLTTATLPAQAGGSGLGTDALVNVPLITTTVTDTFTQNSMPVQLVLTSTTTVYLVAQATFSAGTVTGYGTISAVRRIN